MRGPWQSPPIPAIIRGHRQRSPRSHGCRPDGFPSGLLKTSQSRTKSMKPRSTSAWTSLTRTSSPTSRPWNSRSSRPSVGGWKSRTHVPLSDAPVTMASNDSPILPATTSDQWTAPRRAWGRSRRACKRRSCCATLDRRVLPHQSVHIRDRHEDSDPAVREHLGDRELVQVERVVVVDRRPKPITQIPHTSGPAGRPADGRHFLQRRRWKVRLQASLDHSLARDGRQGGSICGFAFPWVHDFDLVSALTSPAGPRGGQPICSRRRGRIP